MNKSTVIGAGIMGSLAFATASVMTASVVMMISVFLVGPPAPDPAHQDATLMRPALKVDTSGGKVRIHGNWTVLRPVSSGRDHAVSVRLTVVRPSDEKELYSEDLAKIDYRRDHPRDHAYPINKELKFDAAGLDVKVAAVDTADGREFASITVHGTADHPSPGPRKGD